MHFETQIHNGELRVNAEGFDVSRHGKNTLVTYNVPETQQRTLETLSKKESVLDFLKRCDRNDFFILAHFPEADLFYIASDQFGSNEILYKFTDTGIYVTDSIHSLKNSTPELELNYEHINESIAFRLVNPPHTVFKDVFSVPIASALFFEPRRGTREIVEYWNPVQELKNKTHDYDQLIAEIQNGLVESAQQEQPRASSIGVSLSGGIDSGGLLSILHSVTGEKIPSFSVGPHGQGSFDLISARKTAAYNESPQTEMYPTFNDLAKLPKYVGNLSQPQDGQVLLANSIIFDAAKDAGVSRLVYGYGPDHMLGCQKYTRLGLYLDRISFLPDSIQRMLLGSLSAVWKFSENQSRIVSADSWLERYLLIKSMNFWKERKYLLIDSDPFTSIEATEAKKVFARTDIDTPDKLVYADWKLIHIYNRHGMMNKMARPFDMTIYDPAYTILGGTPMFHIPNEFRKLNGWDKQVYRDAVKKFSPQHLYQNKRKGFVLRLQDWFGSGEHPFKNYLMESEILKKVYDIEQFHAEFDDTKETALSTIRLISLALWYDMHFTEEKEARFMDAFEKGRATVNA